LGQTGTVIFLRRGLDCRNQVESKGDISPAAPDLRRNAKLVKCTVAIIRDSSAGPTLNCCGARLPFGPGERMLLLAGTMESSMSKAGLDNRHRNHDGDISHKHGNTLVRTLRKIYGQSFAAGYPETERLSEILLYLNETSLSQLRRDHETGHLEHKVANASK